VLLENITPDMLGDLIDQCASKHATKQAPKDKGTDPIMVRAYVSFHREHWRRRWMPSPNHKRRRNAERRLRVITSSSR